MDKTLIEDALTTSGTIHAAARKLETSYSNLQYWIKKHKIVAPRWRLEHKSERTCPRCNETKLRCEFHRKKGIEGASAYCKRCCSEESAERQKKFKRTCVQYKGGKCIRCGYDKCISALDFHHRDPTQKDFAISHLKSHALTKKVFEELDKCDLVCSNCHREIHDKIGALPEIRTRN